MHTKRGAFVEISIPLYVNTRRYTEYQIVVVAENSSIKNDCFFIYRRYREFRKLHRILEKEIMYLPEFPAKKFWNKSSKVMEERRNKFNLYLKYVGSYILRNGYEYSTSGQEFFRFIQYKIQ
ncbi:hypothetical protein ECANGB1_61 [Enterospora canceri]|uniref:PX domain-containing protein n=1 Tax=Enterospora canceri TaxID=1081671 RepID=A0A1Y1S8H2_9MICR|nr:hypothetical protein ECANGB1_61 [Enterospora canceri]